MTDPSSTDQTPDIEDEDRLPIEGEDNPQSQGWDTYPLDSVFVRQEQRTVIDVVRRINQGRYELNPDFQRDFVWPQDKQSRLIESCLMRLPLPVFYVAESKLGGIIVVDGLQRLTTFKKFLNNEFSLALPSDTDSDDHTKRHTLNGKKFNELDIPLRERIEDTQLIFYIIDSIAPERAKLDIFERVNGGVPLTRQQMRNCLYNGPATRWLKEVAQMPSFKTAMGNYLAIDKMQDREAINRFCSFKLLGVETYKGNHDEFMAQTLEQMNAMSGQALADLQQTFDESMRHNRLLFGRHAFRKSMFHLNQWARRSPINIALFDVCSVLFSEISATQVETHKGEIRQAFSDLLQEGPFLWSISSATGNKKNVLDRFSLARKKLQGVFS
ncbi:MAG: DUF262 domain-containing protein [Magnetococcales bacterium]|nr:DUF262 domain-containing protein [Magnetococcales bacterium]